MLKATAQQHGPSRRIGRTRRSTACTRSSKRPRPSFPSRMPSRRWSWVSPTSEFGCHAARFRSRHDGKSTRRTNSRSSPSGALKRLRTLATPNGPLMFLSTNPSAVGRPRLRPDLELRWGSAGHLCRRRGLPCGFATCMDYGERQRCGLGTDVAVNIGGVIRTSSS